MSAFTQTPFQLRTHAPLPKRCQSYKSSRHQTPTAVSKRMAQAYSSDPLHPVLEILKQRLATNSKPGHRNDKRKVALCIEGGGMRGSVSAGIVAAIKYCGLENTFDVVYGSSAGSIVGAYFVSRQLPVYGAQIYYDVLCSMPESGQRFIDLWAFRHHPYFRPLWKSSKDFYAKGTRPVMLLDRLIDSVIRTQKPLDWKAFSKVHAHQQLKPIASSLSAMEAQTLDWFSSKDELLECLRASARVPGIAGNPVEINGEIYADGLIFEPIPYRSALREGCTDVLVVRSRPGKTGKSKKPGIYEKHIATPCFDKFPSFAPRAKASDFLKDGLHLDIYLEDVNRLEKEQLEPNGSGVAIFSIMPHFDSPVVRQLESRANVIYEGVRSGFAAAYDTLSPFADLCLDEVPVITVKTAKGEELEQRATMGRRVAKWVFDDQELERVQRIHREAKQNVVDTRRKTKKDNEEGRRAKAKARRANAVAKKALRVQAKEKAKRKRGCGDKFVGTIEEQYFLG